MLLALVLQNYFEKAVNLGDCMYCGLAATPSYYKDNGGVFCHVLLKSAGVLPLISVEWKMFYANNEHFQNPPIVVCVFNKMSNFSAMFLYPSLHTGTLVWEQ